MQGFNRGRKGLGVGACAAVIVSLAAVVVAPTPPAAAVTPGIAFSADNLATWQTESDFSGGNGVVWALASSHGKVVAGGTFAALLPPPGGSGARLPLTSLAILDGETGAPDSCQLPVAGGSATVRALTTSPDGNTVYVGGDFSSIGGVARGRLAAIDVVSCTVKSFQVPGISGTVRALAVKGNTLYFGGDFTVVNLQPRQRFAAVNATTGAVLPWVADADAPGRAIGVSPDGTKVAIGGEFFNVNGASTHSIAVVNGTTGANVRTYPGLVPNTSMTHAIWSGQDRFYVGNEGSGFGVFDGRIALSWNSLDEVWRDTCLGATQAVMEYQGALYSASHAHDCSTDAFPDGKRNYLMAQDPATGKLIGWDPRANDGWNEHIGPRALTTVVGNTTGKTYLWAGGEFNQINGAAQVGLTRFGPDDSGSPPTPTVVAEATSEGAIQVRWRSVVDPDDSELTYSVFRNGASTPIWTGSASSVWWKRPQVTYVDNTVTPGQTYSYRVRVTDLANNMSQLSTAVSATANAASSTYASTVRADHPSLYWNSSRAALSASSWMFHEVGAVTSDTRRPHGLAAVAAPPSPALPSGAPVPSADSPIAGDTSGSLSFDGVDDYVWEDEYVPAPAAYSIETWIKTTTTTGGQIVNYGNGRPNTTDGRRFTSTSGKFDRMIYMENSGQIRFGTGDSRQTIRSTQALNDGAWHHVVATQGSNGMALYVDGLRVGTNSLTTSASYNGVWHLGGDTLTGWSPLPTSTFFKGLIDETAIYPTVLSRQTIGAHAQAAGLTPAVNPRPTDTYGGTVFDDDPELYWRLADTTGTTAKDSSYFGPMPGTYGSTVVKGVPGIVAGNSAITTSGSTSGTVAMQTPITPPSVFSGEVWFKTSSLTGGKLLGFHDVQAGGTSSGDKNLYMTNDGRLVFGTFVGGFQTITSPGSYNNGAWHHAVAVLGSSGMKLYVDGTLVASGSATTSQSFTGYWRIGGGGLTTWPNAPTSHYFVGTLDEVAIYNTNVTRSTALRHYAIGVADVQAPSVPTNVTATSSAGVASVSWTASTDNTGVDGYRVYRGTSSGFVPDSTNLVGTTSTTTFSETPPPGDVFYKVVAFDGVPNSSSPSTAALVTVADAIAPSTPANVTATSSGPGAVTVTWTSSTDNVAVTNYSVYRGSTPTFTPAPGNKLGNTGSAATFGDSSVPRGDYFYKIIASDAAGNNSLESAAAAVTVPDYTPPGAPANVTATPSGAQVNLSWDASSDDVAVESYRVYRGTTPSFAVGAASLVGSPTNTSFSDAPPISGTYYYKIVARDGAGNLSDPSAAAQATVTVPDTTPPSAPTNPSTSVSGGSVTVSWSASSDDVGVTGYAVYRGTSSGFTADTSSRIAQSVSTLTYTDTGRPAGTFYYKVRASDAAGNLSAPSPAAAATVAAQTVTLQPIEDATARQAQPTNNTGTENQISALGGSAAQQAFLKFDLPAAPPGAALTGATLALRTSTDASAGSVDSFDVNVMTGAWTESTLTWNNRPTAVGALLGTLTGATATSAAYQVTGSPSALTGAAGSTVTLRIAATGAGTDNVRLWSREASAGLRPVLTLTYSPGADTTAPSTPAPSTQVNGNAVTVSWGASTDDVGVTGYSVFRGTTAGFTADAGSRIAQDITTLSYVDSSRPTGTWYYKVQARDAAGNLSNASTAASATVPDTTKPAKPLNVVASSSGPGAVSVTWNASTDDVAVTGYSVYRGTTSGFTADAGSRIAQDLTTLSYTDSGRPAGTFFYKVTARDAANNASDPSDPASAAVPDYIAPSAPSGLTATVTGDSVGLSWSAATDDVGVTGYSVYRGTTAGFTVDAGSRITDVTGLTYTDTNRPPGTWFYKVVARDAVGNLSSPSASTSGTVLDTAKPSAPGNVVASAGALGAVTVTWNASTDNVAVTGYSVYRGASSGFTPDATNRVAQDLTTLSYTDPGVARGDYFYKVVARDAANNTSDASDPAAVTVPDYSAPSAPSGLTATVTGSSVALSWSASTDDVGVTGYSVYRGTTPGFTADATSRIAQDLTDPSYTDPALPQGTYYYKVQAKDGVGNVSSLSNEAQASITGPDGGPPSTPTNLSATVSGGSVSLSWSAATDDIGVTGYAIYRGTSSSFTPSVANRVTDVTGLTYTDSGRPLGTFYYKVRAKDAVGNLSDPSSAASASVVANTVTLQVIEDASARSGQPTTNVGSENQVSAVGGGTPVWALLKFNLPAAPPGTTITSANLTVRTSTDPSATSIDSYDVHVLNGAWTESALTWNNRPTGVGAKVGTLTGTTALNTFYTLTGDPVALAGLGGSPLTLRISGAGAGSDNLRLWSREAAAASRPVLTVTYSPPTDTSAPTTPADLAANVTGSSVALTWSASSDNVDTTGYSVYRGTSAGFTVDAGSKIADVTDPSYTDTNRPVGTWFYKVKARDAAGNTSGASSAASATVADQVNPSAPTNLAASVTGDSVGLTWTASTDNVGVTGYSVYRGTTAGFTVDAGSKIADVTDPSYTDPNRPAGTWFYKVKARDAAGNASDPSAAAQADVLDQANPSVPTNLAASVTGDSVALSWTASTDNVGVTGYSVYRGTTAGFTVDAGSKIADVTDASHTDANRPVGTWFYKVRARDAAGNASAPSDATSATVADQVNPSAPTNLAASVTGDSVGLSWTASTDNVGVTGYSVYRGTTAGFTADAGAKIADVTDPSYTDANRPAGTWFYKVKARDAAGNASDPSAAAQADVLDQANPSAPTNLAATVTGVSVGLTWTASTDNVGVTGYSVYRGDTAGFTVDAGSKIADVTDTSYTDPNRPAGNWFYKVKAKDAAGNASDPTDAVEATVTPQDTTPPSAPTNLTASVTGDSVALSWTASTDDVGVTGYSVYRGTTAGFTVDAGSKIADVTDASYTDSFRPVGTWFYKVKARDAAGNASDPSAAAQADVLDQANPSAPTNLAATVTGDSVGLTWTASTDNVGVIGYAVYRGDTAGFTVDAGSKIADVTDPSYSDSARPVGTWYYKVRAADAAGNLSNPSDEVSGTVTPPDTVPPSSPTDLATSVTGDSVALSWTASTDDVAVTGYSVYRGTTAGFTADAGSKIADVTTPAYTDAPRPVGTWFYKVKARDAAGNASDPSDAAQADVVDQANPSAPADLGATVTGSSVALTWSASSDNVGVTGYSVYRGTTAGFTVDAGSKIADVTDPSYTDSFRPVGTWFYKVNARDAAGNASDPSAAAQADVLDQANPSAPTNLTATVTGDSVGLTWTASTDNVGVAGYSVYRGTTAGFTVDAGSKIADVTDASYTDANRPVGTWFYKVRARDAAGNASDPSDAASATVADQANPSVPTNLAATVTGDSVGLTWTASTDNVGVTGYSVYRGTTAGFTVDAGSKIADVTDPSYTDANRPVGTWFYKVKARDAAGNASDPSAAAQADVLDQANPSAPTNLAATVTGVSVGLTWTASTDNVGVTGYSVYRGTTAGFTVDAGSKIADVTDASYTDANRPAGTWFYKVKARDAAGNASDPSAAAQADVPDQVNPSTPTNVAATVTGDSVALSWTASTDNVGVTGYSVYRGTTAGFTADAGSKIADVTDPSFNEIELDAGTYYYKVKAKDAAGNASDPSAAASATVVPEDTTPPSTPTNLATSVSGGSVSLTWTASTDNVGVTGYSVYRGTTSGFTPSAGNRVTDVTNPTYTDTGRPLGTYYYKVKAKDAAGNASNASTQASATVAPSTVTLTPVEDATARQAQPTNNTGAENQISANGGTSAQQAFMKFNLPAAPPGTSLSGVNLALRTSSDSTAASVDSFDVHVATGAWSESTLNWNNRPTGVGAKVGTLTGTTALSTAYQVTGTPSALAGLAGTTVTLRLSAAGSGTDNVRLWSKEWTSAAQRPTLTLTYSPPGDATAPTAPTVSTQVSGSTVTVSWDGSTDNVDVTGYSVFRGTTAGFTADAGSRLAQDLTTQTYTDSARPAGTWYYKVTARDAAGNVSAPSAAASATVTGLDPVTPGASATVVAAGDLVCPAGTTVTATSCKHPEVRALLDTIAPDRFIPLGDLAYNSGTYAEFTAPGRYADTFGSLKPNTLPVIGNHEGYTANAQGYWDYFYGAGVTTGSLGNRPTGFYSAVIGSWRFIGLNSECQAGGTSGGCGPGSPQYAWLQALLSQDTAQCTIAAWHQPRWTTGASHAPYTEMAPMWDLMANAGVDVALTSHNHVAEVFKPIGASGTAAQPVLSANGIRSFTVGTGGASHQNLQANGAGQFAALDTRARGTFGLLKLDLQPGSYNWELKPIAGSTFTNSGTTGAFSGTGTCH
jgi:hypothetical protein